MEQARQSIEAKVLERAAEDPQFREQLKQDPRGTISRDFGVQVPSDITVEVVEETPQKVYLVLPPATAQRGQELSGPELEEVAGGWLGYTANQTGGCESCVGTCQYTACYEFEFCR